MRLAKLQTFKFSNFSFYQYFFTAYIGLHVTFSILLGNITAFAPDEGLYKSIFSRLYSAGFTSDVLGFSGAWEPWLRLIYLPAKLLTYLGFTDLLAVRFLAIGCSSFATYLVVQVAKSNHRDDRIFRAAIISISFIPTVFLWSSIGLRESFLYLSISAILFSLSRIHIEPKWYWFLVLSISLLSLSQTKSYIFVIMMIALILSVLIEAIKFRKFKFTHLLLIFITLIPILVNPSLAEAVRNGGEAQIIAAVSEVPATEPVTETATDSTSELTKDPANTVLSRGMTIHALVDQLSSDSHSLISRIANKLGLTAKLEAISKSSVVVVGSEEDLENKTQLSLKRATFTSPDLLTHAIARFMFVPLLLTDNGSLFLNIQSIETPVWIFMYLLFFTVIFYIAKGRRFLDYATTTAVIFVIEFVLLSALTEINVGTALRHRSLLLIPILVIWASRERKPASL